MCEWVNMKSRFVVFYSDETIYPISIRTDSETKNNISIPARPLHTRTTTTATATEAASGGENSHQ